MWPFRKVETETITPAGRKYRLAILCVLFIVGCYCFTIFNPILIKVFTELVSGIIGIYLCYCGGNASAALIAKRYAKIDKEVSKNEKM